MKVILGRKWFDSENGKMPSAFMQDGGLVSFLIPAEAGFPLLGPPYKGLRYNELISDQSGLWGDGFCHCDSNI